MCTLLRPLHLLFFSHTFSDHFIDRGFYKATGNGLTITPSLIVVWDYVSVVFNIGYQLLNVRPFFECYIDAREAILNALIEDQLLIDTNDLSGIHVMTIHKSKGKQFDAVIIYREGICLGRNQWQSTLVWREDPFPHARSRKILRVGITRAKHHVLMLEPFSPCWPILSAYNL
jgi:hypothetical protein